MPSHRTQVQHSIGRDVAIRRLQTFVAKNSALCCLDGSWDGGRYTFTASTQGIRIGGVVTVQDDVVSAEVRLPLIALPFVGWLPAILRRGLNQQEEEEGIRDQHRDGRRAEAGPHAEREDGPVTLFLHIPKAGGSTLSDYIFAQCRDPRGTDDGLLNAGVYFYPEGFFCDGGSSPEYIKDVASRPDLRAVVGHFSFGLQRLFDRETRLVTVLREPVDRVVSLYAYLQLEGRMSLEQFAEAPPFPEASNDQTRRISGVAGAPALCSDDDLRAAQDNLRRHTSVVGLTERLDETLVLMRRRFGWDLDVPSFPKNTNPRRPRMAEVPATCAERIRRLNALDVALYRSAVELLDRAVDEEGPGFQADLEAFRALRLAAG
jgi:hypothetical protein